MSFSLRIATPEDTATICQIYRFSILDLCAEHYSVDQLMAWAGIFEPVVIRKAIADGTAVCLVAEKDGKIAGFSILYGESIRAVYVHPLFARHGAGTLLLKATEDAARRKGAKKIYLTASLNSRRFYEGLGYTVTCRAEFPLTGGLVMSCFKMERDL